MAAAHQQRDSSYTKNSTREIFLPDGYELAHYTLRRVCDGHLQSYLMDNNTGRVVQATPMAAHSSGVQLQEDHGLGQSNQDLGLSPQVSSTNHNSYSNHMPDQQLPRISAYGEHQNLAPPDNRAQNLSARTLKRHAHARDDNYTDVCGVFSLAKATPVKKHNPGNGDFCCPICESSFTRPKSVKDHFPDCVSKYGNPQALRYTDHPSMAQKEAAIQRRSRESREVSSMSMEEDDNRMQRGSQGIKFEEMNDALARTSIRGTQDGASACDGPRIKTEFMFGADIAYESVETRLPEYEPLAIDLDAHHTFLRPTSLRSKVQIAQTPEWQPTRGTSPYPPSSTPTPQNTSFRSRVHISETPDWQANRGTSPRPGSSTPTPHTNPWNVGVPGSAAEHVIMDMRATAPFEGYPHEAQTPERTNRDGLQDDGLDGFMDRRSYFSPTPAASTACASPKYSEYIYEDLEMEE